MNTSYQHRFIGQHLQNKYGHLRHWPFSSASQVEIELCRACLSLSVGDFLVIEVGRNGVRFGKVADLEGLAAFSRDSLVISYHELERAFYEQHADWVEL